MQTWTVVQGSGPLVLQKIRIRRILLYRVTQWRWLTMQGLCETVLTLAATTLIDRESGDLEIFEV
jgi:hypothetical protein